MVWQQIYDPFGNPVLSTLMAAVPVVVMLAALAFFHVKAHLAALLALASALLISIFAFDMPAGMAGSAALFGAANGLLPIGWIVLNIIFLHRLTTENGSFKVLQDSLARITDDRRLQLLLIAFCFGAFFEGAAGFGTPVAVTGAILIGLGFSPLAASGLALIANTAPVAFGALGTPIITLAKVTGLDEMELSMMVGRQLPFFSVLVPFWLIWAFAGWRKMLEVWPAILVAGVSFAIPQFLVSNYHGPMLVDVIAALISMACLTLFLKVWKPATIHTSAALSGRVDNSKVDEETVTASAAFSDQARPAVMRAWMPWIILTVFVFAWGTQGFKNMFDTRPVIDPVTQSAKLDPQGKPVREANPIFAPALTFTGLHLQIEKVPPVVAAPKAEEAIYKFTWLTATGSGILLAAIVGGLLMGYSIPQLIKQYLRTLWVVRFSLITIAAMLALGFLTRYSGLDATMGLAFAATGIFYPMFGTLLGWLGVALTGSDTASNVLFGGLQRVTSEQLGISPVLMAAANSSGGVMGKMVDAQSIVVASTATRWYGHEGEILRYVFFHSIVLAILVGGLVTLQAYVAPFTSMVVGGP
ncbi:L-lactate permease [Pseudomonas moraviensis]|jgi:lactate permease|uniref:L-lactate permease n=1 Tax=Pseudomonas atacamensis TaxID=2565368 RepID=A0ABQ5PG65_9PSED|nr:MULTISPECIES: L-lactate permease [Pseudomonas]MBJ7372870.1 L-lactate permease [Pseudomonas sp.]MCI9873805.1 L-lactate permease [Pseudomonas atacamensis]MCW0922149.1 L-lactate permease [Pseudomonas sp. RG1]MXI47821.1 L-lactate permease [Pseudomonas moraviensis]UVK91660.1 L-lactate permease [Pseudomonas atacamensis]